MAGYFPFPLTEANSKRLECKQLVLVSQVILKRSNNFHCYLCSLLSSAIHPRILTNFGLVVHT